MEENYRELYKNIFCILYFLIDTTGHPTTFLNWKMPAMLVGVLVVKPLTAPGVTLLIVKSDGNIVILRNATGVLKVETFVAL